MSEKQAATNGLTGTFSSLDEIRDLVLETKANKELMSIFQATMSNMHGVVRTRASNAECTQKPNDTNATIATWHAQAHLDHINNRINIAKALPVLEEFMAAGNPQEQTQARFLLNDIKKNILPEETRAENRTENRAQPTAMMA